MLHKEGQKCFEGIHKVLIFSSDRTKASPGSLSGNRVVKCETLSSANYDEYFNSHHDFILLLISGPSLPCTSDDDDEK